MKKISMFLRNQPPGRMIVGGFAGVILFGMILLLLPISVKDGAEVSAIDALFTSTSAVCVTGLIAIDTADHFTAFGQGIVADWRAWSDLAWCGAYACGKKKSRNQEPNVGKRSIEYRQL